MKDEISLLETILGFLPFVLILGGFLLFLLMRGWRRDALGAFSALKSEARAVQTDYQKLQKEARIYSVEDPAPFGVLAAEMFRWLNEIESDLSQFYQEYGWLHGQINVLSKPDWTMVWRLPLAWYGLRRRTYDLAAALDHATDAFIECEKTAARLRKMGWEMARSSREILASAQQAGQIFESLNRDRLIVDARLDSAWQDACEWEETILAQVPVVFLSEDETAVLSQADKETTAHIYRVVKGAQPAVADLLSQAQDIQGNYDKLVSLSTVFEKEFKDAVEKYHRLEGLPAHPIQWEKSLALWQRLEQQAANISPARKQRTLNELQAELNALQGLQSRLTDFVHNITHAHAQQHQISSLLLRLDAELSDHWLKQARELAAQVKNYSSENWPKVDSVQTFNQDFQELARQRETLLPKNAARVLRENDLMALLEQLQTLEINLQQFDSRATAIQARLREIRELEQESRDPLMQSRMLIAQIVSFKESNPFLRKATGQEIEKLLSAVEQLLAELDLRSAGAVEVKAKKTSALLKRVEQSIDRWQQLLDADVEAYKANLTEKVLVLEEKVRLDEPALKEAVQLIKQDQVNEKGVVPRSGDALLLAMVARLKSSNDAWQNCMANHKKVDEFAGTVVNVYEKADKHRRAALEKFTKAESIAPENLIWPPSTRRLTSERQQLQALETQWADLPQTPKKAIQAVAILGNLSDGYHTLEIQLGGLVDAVKLEQERIVEFERRLEESRKLWRRQLQHHRENRLLQQGVESVLEQIDQDHAALKLRYERGGIQYAQALQGMRQLCRKIDDAMIPVDNLQEMDINGILLKRS